MNYYLIVILIIDGATPNGETPAIMPSPNTLNKMIASSSGPIPTTTSTTAKKSLPQKKTHQQNQAKEKEATTPVNKKSTTNNSESYLCSMPGCGENFVIKQHLQNHERTCNMKKYPCPSPGCDRRFKNSKQRHAHMTSRHKGTENAFRCTVPLCTAVFKTSDRLKVHESRCRFKYEQFQLMDLDALESANNNNTSFTPSTNQQSSVPNLNSSSAESMVQQPSTNTAFASLQQAATIIQNQNSSQQQHHQINLINTGASPIKLENGNQASTVQFQGFSSTVDLSLVKSEME